MLAFGRRFSRPNERHCGASLVMVAFLSHRDKQKNFNGALSSVTAADQLNRPSSFTGEELATHEVLPFSAQSDLGL